MKPSEKVKAAGLASLKQVSELTGESEQTLINWSKRYPKRFAIMIEWCSAKLAEPSGRTDE